MPCPVTAGAVTQNHTAAATSAGAIRRPIGCLRSRVWRALSSVRPVTAALRATVASVMGVSTYPGHTALTVTPVLASSAAADRTRPSTPCLLAVYAAMEGSPILAALDAITTIRPQPPAR